MSIAVLRKPLAALIEDDILELIRDSVREGETVDYKVDLSTKGGGLSEWKRGKKSIAPSSTGELAKLMAGFANAQGGCAILGMDETPDKPPRAKAISPFPEPHDLADRLRQSIRDAIEPMLPTFDAVGVTTGSGIGIVVLRTGASIEAPHRVIDTRVFPRRWRDQTLQMSTRDIRELVLSRATSYNFGEKLLDEQLKDFDDTTRLTQMPAFGDPDLARFDYWIGVAPTRELDAGRLMLNDILRGGADVEATVQSKKVHLPTWPTEDWRPILRGVRSVFEQGEVKVTRAAWRNGTTSCTIEAGAVGEIGVAPHFFLGMVAETIWRAFQLRNLAGAPDTELIVQAAINVGGHHQLKDLFGPSRFRHSPLDEGMQSFPPLRFVSPSEASEALAEIERDIWDATGHRRAEGALARVDFTGAQPS